MPWQQTDPMNERVKRITDYQSGDYGVSALPRRYGVSRKTVSKWLSSHDWTVVTREIGYVAKYFPEIRVAGFLPERRFAVFRTEEYERFLADHPGCWRVRQTFAPNRRGAPAMNIPEVTLNAIRSLVAAGEKIEAIKLLRKHHPVSLADAVPLVEWIAKNDPTIPMPQAATVPGGEGPASRRGRAGNSMGWARWLFLGVGLILLGVAAWLYWSEVVFRREAVRVEAVVVDNLPSRRSFTPVFEYTWNGEKLRSESNFASAVNGRPVYKVGEKVVVMVQAKEPERVHVDSWFGSWFACTVVGGIGVVFTIIGTCVVIFFRRV